MDNLATRNSPIMLRTTSILQQAGLWRKDLPEQTNPDKREYGSGLDSLDGTNLIVEALPSVNSNDKLATILLKDALDRRINGLKVNKSPLVASYNKFNKQAHGTEHSEYACFARVAKK